MGISMEYIQGVPEKPQKVFHLMNYEPFGAESCCTLAAKCSGKDYYLSTKFVQIIGRLSNKSMQNLYKSIKYSLVSSWKQFHVTVGQCAVAQIETHSGFPADKCELP